MCRNGQAGTRELWAIGPPCPSWQDVAAGNGADEATRARIEAHYHRSRGSVNLLPSQAPNPIVLG
jgi:hypothetical protein